MENFNREKIKSELKEIIVDLHNKTLAEIDIRKNTLDIFSASIECSLLNISLDEWKKLEKKRQIQKTLQNRIGDMHQNILATFNGINNLGTGKIVDLESTDKNFISEVKNKHNTTKGNHKVAIYDDIKSVLSTKNKNTIGYYIEILPENGKLYNEEFQPSDNKISKRREKDKRIRRIDGKSMYEIITGDSDALKKLYCLLAELTAEILKEEFSISYNYKQSISLDEFDIIYKKKEI